MMDKGILEKLRQAFDKKLIKRTPAGASATGQQVDYVKVPYYIERLNDVCEGEWSDAYKTWHDEKFDTVFTLCTLTIKGISHQSSGGCPISRKKNGQLMDLADDYKKAEADALKKACTKFGLGLDLHGITDKYEAIGGGEPEPKEKPAPAATPPPAAPAPMEPLSHPADALSKNEIDARIKAACKITGKLYADVIKPFKEGGDYALLKPKDKHRMAYNVMVMLEVQAGGENG